MAVEPTLRHRTCRRWRNWIVLFGRTCDLFSVYVSAGCAGPSFAVELSRVQELGEIVWRELPGRERAEWSVAEDFALATQSVLPGAENADECGAHDCR